MEQNHTEDLRSAGENLLNQMQSFWKYTLGQNKRLTAKRWVYGGE